MLQPLVRQPPWKQVMSNEAIAGVAMSADRKVRLSNSFFINSLFEKTCKDIFLGVGVGCKG